MKSEMLTNSGKVKSTQLPRGWELVKLGDTITELKNGFATGKRDQSGIVQVRMNNVTTDGKLTFTNYLKVPIPENVNFWTLKSGDFLFNNTNSVALVGKSTIFYDAPFPCTFSNHFTRIRFNEDFIIPEFVLNHFILLWRKGYFKSVAIRHVGQAAVQTKYIEKLKIPLPPLPEQKKIAQILTTMDNAIQKVDEAITTTQRMKKGLMQELLTKGIGHTTFKEVKGVGTVPEAWDVVKINSIGDVITGKTPSTSNKLFWNGDIPFITPGEIAVGKYANQSNRYLTLKGVDNVAKLLPKDTVMVVCIGSTIGKVAMTFQDSVTNQQINSIICDGDIADPSFLFYSISRKSMLIKSIAGTAAVPIIKKSLFEQITIPLPPLPEQKKIAEILSTVDRKIELERKRKEKLERIKKGLMNDLLTGKVRVKVEVS